MASFRAPGLGPIIGHTTSSSARIWIRGQDPGDEKSKLASDRRTVGVVGIVSADGKSIERAWYFRLKRDYDRTGTFFIGADVGLGEHAVDIAEERKARPTTPLRHPSQVQPLAPDTSYRIRTATISIDDPIADDETLEDWELRLRLPNLIQIKDELLAVGLDSGEATVKTFPNRTDAKGDISFLLGSCRYSGLLWKTKESDKIFRPMLEQVQKAKTPAIQFQLMVGDQIYADPANALPLGLAETFEEFQKRYSAAFGSPNMRQLMRNCPTYMILDDHEIEDNWTQDRLKKHSKHKLFNNAIGAYLSYQWSHGPRTWGKFLYYTFDCGGYPFFVLDTRTQRYKDGNNYEDEDGLFDNHLLGPPTIDKVYPSQLDELLTWLENAQARIGNAPKFIVSSSVFAPNDMKERIYKRNSESELGDTIDDQLYRHNLKRRSDSDSWPAYPNTRAAILKKIVSTNIQNVVFLSGDIHCSNIAELRFTGPAAHLKAFSVTSSAFYWPFFFADGDPNSYVHDSETLEGQEDPFPVTDNVTMHYQAYGFTQEDNFTRIDVDAQSKRLNVGVFDQKGNIVTTGEVNGTETPLKSIQLAPW